MGSKALFVAAFCVILSMYGGGFATYLLISPTFSERITWARSTGGS
jgi:hypothetical protein